jgi:gliding motility-associated-like protein
VKGCQFRDTVEIISDGSMPVVTPKARVDCETSIYSLDFSEIDGGTPPYYLLFEEYNDADFLIENLQPGTYKYQILDAAGCDSRITEIQLFEIPEIMIANRDTFIVAGDPIYLSAFVDTSIFRDFDWMNEYRDICDHCLDTIYENAEEGTYFFTYDFKLFDGSNCERTHRFRVRYLQDKIYIPNAFSPNSDNVNDLFEIYAPNHEVVNLQIYNRWGDQIFSSAGPDFQWNGQVGSTKAEQGVYVYQVLLKSSNGKTQWESGSITLIR